MSQSSWPSSPAPQQSSSGSPPARWNSHHQIVSAITRSFRGSRTTPPTRSPCLRDPSHDPLRNRDGDRVAQLPVPLRIRVARNVGPPAHGHDLMNPTLGYAVLLGKRPDRGVTLGVITND